MSHEFAPRVERARWAWDLGLAGLASATLFIALTGGGRLAVAGLGLTARDWTRPAALLAILGLCRAGALWRARGTSGLLQRGCDQLGRAGLATIVMLMGALGLRALVDACGGLDSHGYVSTAHALLSGHLVVPQPIAAWLPLERPMESLAPLGWVPAVDGRAIVPRFPLGLPLVMAAFEAVAGRGGPFYVAPVLAAATVALVFVLARRAGGARAAGLAAALVAAHPLFFTYAIQPMSDVPATFWVVLAVALLYRDRQLPVLAGLAAGMAILTRPPLALAALVLAPFSANRARFAAGVLPFVGLFLATNTVLYGRPLSSGYGASADLFALHIVPRNMAVYGKWLLIVNTPLLIALLAAAVRFVDRRFFILCVAVFAAVSLPYLFYVFEADDWEMLRFLLPGLVLLLTLAAIAAAALAERYLPAPAVPIAVLALAAGVAAVSYGFLRDRNVFRLYLAESKYPAVASWIEQNSPPDAIVLAALHSGSVRHYSGRTTLRWDQIPPERLAPTISAAAARNRAAFLVLDGDTERAEFTRRFGGNPGVDIAFVDRVQNVYVATMNPRP
jgi:hypothetical protein